MRLTDTINKMGVNAKGELIVCGACKAGDLRRKNGESKGLKLDLS